MANIKTPLTKLLWVDLEMTGLDPKKDIILEIAALITDFDFKVLDTYGARVKHAQDRVEELLNANSWYREQVPENKELFLKPSENAKSLLQVEDELIEFVTKNFGDETMTLAGNSVHFDKTFIEQYWPRLNRLLHYRVLDVSSWKIIMNAKYNIEYPKNNTHRALDDILESIAELKFYLDWFDQNKPKK